MFGRVDFTYRGRRHSAVLEDDRTWTVRPSPDAIWRLAYARILQQIATDEHGPADGPYGPLQLSEAATLLRGTSVPIPSGFSPPGRVY